jgi:site-specific DNA recombinase
MIRHAFDLYRARAGYAAILEYLNAPDHLPLFRRKSPFTKAVLFSMLSNEIYSGVYVRRLGADPRHRVTSPETIRVPGGVPAILTPDEWHQVETIRSENKTAQALYTARTVYPLSGLVFCGVCGKRMPLNHGGKSRSGEPERYYTCRNHCVKPARLENAETALFSALEYYNQHETQLRRACTLANDYSAGADLDNSAQAAKLEKEIQQNNRKTARLIQFIEEHGASAPASMLQELTALEQRNDSIRQQIKNLTKPRARYDADKTVQAVRAVLANKKTPPEQLQQLIHAAVFRVRVHPDSYEIILAWHACGGDEPPRYVCHAVPRPVR